jgi:hypothetical protein
MLGRFFGTSGDAVNPATLEEQLPGEYPCSVHLRRVIGYTRLSVPSLKGSRVITVENTSGIEIGSRLSLMFVGNYENDFLTVTDINGSILTVDRQLDVDHAGYEIVNIITEQLNSSPGSFGSPVVYEFYPHNGLWRVESMSVFVSGSSEFSFEKFGSVAALEYGIHIKGKSSSGRDCTFGVPFISNKSMVTSGCRFVSEYSSGYSLSCFTLDMHRVFGANFIISPATGFFAYVQDDMSSLDSVEIKINIREIGFGKIIAGGRGAGYGGFGIFPWGN